MRAQRRRFVVEVKRGTSRASFLSTDPAPDKFSNAEDALFGPKTKVETPKAQAVEAASAPAGAGRILRDLHEPPPAPPPELPPPARRGRKPGSKNKPKPALSAVAPSPAPRPSWADWAEDDAAPATAVEPMVVPPAAESAPDDTTTSKVADTVVPLRRGRLRERSTILKRYVLGTEPVPGQSGWVRSLRARRRG